MTLNPNQTISQGTHQSPSDKTPAPLAVRSSDVAFIFQGVQPPSLLYVDVDDQLILQAATSQTTEVVTVNVRLLLPNGRIEDMQFIIRPVNTRTVLRQSFALAQGYILSASAVASVATTRGQTFLRIATQRSASGAGNPAQMLFADYVTTQATSAYPNGRILAPTEGPGFVYAFQQANPAAGADWTMAVPANARWKVRCVNALLTTSATVANRQPQIRIQMNGIVPYISTTLSNITAGLAAQVSMTGITPYTEIVPTDFLIGLPPDILLNGSAPTSGALSTVTNGIQAGDQWSQIVALVEEWLDNI